MEEKFLDIVESSIKNNWNLPAFSDYKGDTYRYSDFAVRIAKLHIMFEKAGIVKGDKIALVGRNSSHWAISLFGILSYGAVAVPILHEFKPDNIHHIINHSEAKALMAGEHNLDSLNMNSMPNVEFIVKLEKFSIIKADNNLTVELIDECFKAKYPSGYTQSDIIFHNEEPEELAVLNYTSGTVGFSKGVMLPYRSLWSNTRYANDSLPFIHSGDNLVCMLPMAHMYGLAFETLNGVGKGCHIYFLPRVPSPNIVLEALAKIKPTLILAVPLIIEKILRSRVFPQLEKPLIRFLLKIPLVNNIIYGSIARKLNQAFGGMFSEVVIGGAALNRDVENFLKRIKFRYTVGYGLTECGPLVAYTQWDSFKSGSVGQIVDRMEVRINEPNAENVGEIWVRGMNNMLGYYKNPDATNAIMLEDGWMNTGDLGTFDKDKFLYIKGRSKTMILSSNGQNIYPEEIESELNNLPFVLESLVIYQEGKLIALIYPDWETAKKEQLGKNDLEIKMEANIATLNRVLPVYSKIATFKLRDEEFEKTPKRNIRRYLYQSSEQ